MNHRNLISISVYRGANLLAAFIVLSMSGCASVTTQGPTTLTDPPMQVTLSDRENTALAFISYTGDKLDFPVEIVDPILYWCVKNELATQPLTKNKYQLVWGPAVFRFKDVRFDDNMMYVVRREGSNQLVVAIRGTNFVSSSDWLVEDLFVTDTVPWNVPEKNRASSPTNPRISRATDIGLKVLQTLTAEFPGVAPKTIREFLTATAGKDTLDQVTIVGHSLAGALAPAFALWLSDTRSEWDPNATIELSVTALAGATGGNYDYSTYYDSQLGKSTRRIHNPYDMVPLGWNMNTLMSLPGLYARNGINASGLDRFLIQQALNIAEGVDYTQILPNVPSLEGGVLKSSGTTKYLQQAAWQHHCGYYCALDIAQGSETPLNPLQGCAGTNSRVVCDVCPGETP